MPSPYDVAAPAQALSRHFRTPILIIAAAFILYRRFADRPIIATHLIKPDIISASRRVFRAERDKYTRFCCCRASMVIYAIAERAHFRRARRATPRGGEHRRDCALFMRAKAHLRFFRHAIALLRELI